ncbi:MAG: TraR/DksA C4-type zinc finger protein [Candidatus Marinimicrobia bacterium]|nr:TraR/DksA C4-type zinc finger protein [Candidatus Neomarinimicrobiota bacterium]
MATKINRWPKRDLAHFRKRLNIKRIALLDEMGELRQNTRIADESTSSEDATYSSHMADAGTDQGEREKAYYWLARENNYLRYLERAMEMIEDGSFGICQTCGDFIDKERLEEVPHTSSCFSCKTNIPKPVDQ